MKKIVLLPISLLASGLLCLNENPSTYKLKATDGYVIATDGCSKKSLPKYIDLNDVSDTDIRSYYSSLISLSEEERKGTNLLKNLKPILYQMNYYTYDDIWKAYEITDRNWELSPASEDVYGDYDSTSKTYSNYVYKKNNPYVHTLYRDLNDESGYIKEWGDHTINGTNREHVWCQSRGFKAPEGAEGPAGTDLHHLISGDGYVNQQIHNNSPYGFVNVVSKVGNQEYTKNNKLGTAKHTSSEDQATLVFEPQDSDKGDIARAIFYMAARYNNYSGTDVISDYEPNLIVVNYATDDGKTEMSSVTHPVGMGILSDLLAWNKLDPVDEYEIHRNNLIYRNYQGNRNPFIDFPEWADYIWGTVDNDGSNYNPTVTRAANPNSDAINDKGLSLSITNAKLDVNETAKVRAFTADESGIIWESSNSNIVELSKTASNSGEEITLTAKALGSAIIIARATVEGVSFVKEISVSVKHLESISVSGMKTEYKTKEKFTTDGMVVTAHYSDESTEIIPLSEVAIIEPDMTTKGEKVVTVTYKNVSASFIINVKGPNIILYAAIGGGALVLITVVIIVFAKSNKKTKKKIISTVKKGAKTYKKANSKKK